MLLSDYVRLTPRNGKYSAAMTDARDAFIRAFFEIEPACIPASASTGVCEPDFEQRS